MKVASLNKLRDVISFGNATITLLLFIILASSSKFYVGGL